MVKYVGRPESAEYGHVGPVFRVDQDKRRTLRPRLDLVNHSPTGFGWNYGGSGPAQLSLAILADATGDDRLAVKYHQAFKFDKICRLPRADWEIDADDVLEWVKERQAKDDI